MRIHQGVPKKVRGGWAVSIREPTRVTEMGETIADGGIEAGDYVEVETRRGKKWLARIDNIGSSGGGVATVFTERLSDEEQEAVRAGRDTSQRSPELTQHRKVLDEMLAEFRNQANRKADAADDPTEGRTARAVAIGASELIKDLAQSDNLEDMRRIAASLTTLMADLESKPAAPATPAGWDSLPADIQERVLTAVANDRPYLNAVQNSDAQNAGTELAAALGRAVRDEGMALPRNRQVSDADRDAYNALSQAVGAVKQDSTLRDRLAARVRGMTTPARTPVSEMSDGAGSTPAGRRVTANLDPAGESITAIVPKDDRQPQAGDWVDVSLPVTISADRSSKHGGGRQKYELTPGTSDVVDESGSFRTYRWQVADLIPREHTPPGGQGAPGPDTAALRTPEERDRIDANEPVPDLSASGLADDVARQAYTIIREAHELAREQDVLSSTARQRLPEDKRHTKPRYNKAERERGATIEAAFERTATEYDELAKRHGITDEQRAIIADLSNPIGKHLDDEEARQVFRHNWGYAAAVNGEEEAFRVAQWAVDNWRERGGNEGLRKEGAGRQRVKDERRAVSEQKLAWIREKLAAGESVQFVTAMYGGAGATRMGGPTVTPALMAQWDAVGQDLLRIGPEGDLMMATGGSGRYVSQSLSALVASDGQTYNADGGMGQVRHYKADPEEFRGQYKVATPAVNRALKTLRVAKTREQFGAAIDAAGGVIRHDTDADRQAAGQEIYGGRRVFVQLDPDNPGSIINAIWWGDNDPVEATRLWAGRSGPHQYVEDVSGDGVFAGWHEPANRTATDSAPPPLAESWSGTANVEPPAVRLWVGRALTQGEIPAVLTVRAAEPGDEVQFVLSGQDLYQDLGGVYTSVVPLQDVKPADARLLTAQAAEVLLLDKSPVLVAPGVIPVGAPVRFEAVGRTNYGHVQGGPKDRRTFRIENPRRSRRARAGRIAAAR